MRILMLILVLGWMTGARAQAAKPDAKAKEDIAVHRIIATAHEKAARCLEAGKTEKECHAQLAKDCKGHGIGKYCGMRHRH